MIQRVKEEKWSEVRDERKGGRAMKIKRTSKTFAHLSTFFLLPKLYLPNKIPPTIIPNPKILTPTFHPPSSSTPPPAPVPFPRVK